MACGALAVKSFAKEACIDDNACAANLRAGHAFEIQYASKQFKHHLISHESKSRQLQAQTVWTGLHISAQRVIARSLHETSLKRILQ